MGFTGHVAQYLGELPLVRILRFCDRHGIAADELAVFVATHRHGLPLHRPDLTEYVDALAPYS